MKAWQKGLGNEDQKYILGKECSNAKVCKKFNQKKFNRTGV